jgi:hypothetical protein
MFHSFLYNNRKVTPKSTNAIFSFMLLLTATVSSLMSFNPLTVNAQVTSSSLMKGASMASSTSGNTVQVMATNTALEYSKLLTGGIATDVQFLGQSYPRAMQLPAVQMELEQHNILFHLRDPVAFALAKKEAQSIISRIKIFTQRQLEQSYLPGQPHFAQTIQSPTPSQSLNSSPLASQASSVSSPISQVIPGFDGLTQRRAGFNGLTYFPPDAPIAAGQKYVFQMVNLAGEVFTKQGVSVSTFALPTFFKVSNINDRLSDPRIIYDSISERWFASLGDGSTNDVRVAVSTTNDPTGVWNIYRFALAGCPDQPGIAMNNDKFAISANVFASSCNDAFTGVQYFVVDKSDLVNGVSSPRFVQTNPDSSIFSVYPVQSLSSSSTLYMVSVGDDQDNSIKLYSITGTVPTNNVAVKVVSLPIETTHVPPGGIQPGTSATIDTGDSRVQSAVWYQGKMWLALNDACKPPGDTQSRSCIRFDQIDTATDKVLQDFDKGDVGVYYFYPGLQIDGSGNLDFIYGYSSASTYPSLAASGQAAGSGADRLLQPIILKLGSADDISGRYGDYFEGAVDPSNTTIAWVAGEYHSSQTWSTFISAVSQKPATTTTPPPPTTLHSTTLTLNLLATSVPWGAGVTLAGKLTDNNSSDTGIGGRAISFTGTGAINITNAETNKDGTFTARGTAPDTVAGGWTVQAHFAGDSLHNPNDSNVVSYHTIKHTTSLTLIVSPTSVTRLGTYGLSGILMDASLSKGLEGKTITFTAPSPITLSPVPTNSIGQYDSSVLSAPNTTATYDIQAHFAGDLFYSLVNSVVKTLTVTNTSPTPSFPPSPPFPFPSLPGPTTITNSTFLQNFRSHIQQQIQALLLSLQRLKLQEQQQLQQELEQHVSPPQLYQYRAGKTAPPIVNNSHSFLNLQQQQQHHPIQSSNQYPYLQSQQQHSGEQQNLFTFHNRSPILSSLYQNLQHLQHYPYNLRQEQQNQIEGLKPRNSYPPEQQQPIANAGVSQTVYGGTTVTLDGTGSYDPDGKGMIVTYQWSQVLLTSTASPATSTIAAAGIGVPLILYGASTATPVFLAPILPYDTMLAFSLKVVDSDAGGVSVNPAIVYIMVKHNPNLGNSPAVPWSNYSNSPLNQQQQLQHQQPQQQGQLLEKGSFVSPKSTAIGGPFRH